MAEQLSTRPRARHVLVGLWSAEEIGLIGSAAFVASGGIKPGEIAAYLNFDMVGRMVDNRLAVQATGTSGTWPALLEQVNVAAGFDLALQPDPYQPTDVANFNQAGVPSLSFTTGRAHRLPQAVGHAPTRSTTRTWTGSWRWHRASSTA